MADKISNSKWAAIVATGLAGLVTGSLAFASAVDVRSFKTHIQDEVGTNLARNHFMVWWPYGRDWMVPLNLATSVAFGVAWKMTKKNAWAAAGVCISLIGPYTKVILMEDINALRDASSGKVKETATRFCNRHHVRLVMAAAGFITALINLAEM